MVPVLHFKKSEHRIFLRSLKGAKGRESLSFEFKSDTSVFQTTKILHY